MVNAWTVDFLKTLEVYWSKPWNRECEILLAEAKFEVMIGPFKFAGRIDQLRRYTKSYEFENIQIEAGEIHLNDFKTGESKITPGLLELGYQPSIYAWGLLHGSFIEDSKKQPNFGGTKWNVDKICLYRTMDHLPYKKRTVVKLTGEIHEVGDERGPGMYLTTRCDKDFEAMITDLGYKCRQIVGPHYGTNKLVKGGAFAREISYQNGTVICDTCDMLQECLADRHQANIDTTNITISEEDIVNV